MLSHVRLFAAPWTLASLAPLSVGFPRQQYWSGLPFPAPEILLLQGSNPHLFHLLHWQVSVSGSVGLQGNIRESVAYKLVSETRAQFLVLPIPTQVKLCRFLFCFLSKGYNTGYMQDIP